MARGCVLVWGGVWAWAMSAGAQCPNPTWSSQFAQGGLTGFGSSMTVLDADGPGPQAPTLFVGGNFQTAGGVASPGVARWNGQAWQAVPGAPTVVHALGVFDPDGPGPVLPRLVAQGMGASGASMWDGVQWSGLGTMSANAEAFGGMVEYDPDGPGPALPELWMSGFFPVEPPGAAGPAVVRWNGVAWLPVGEGTNVGGRYGIAVYDEDAGGTVAADGVCRVGGERRCVRVG